jgi:hypothetical protein
MKNQKPALTLALFLPDICMNIIRTCSMGVSMYVCRLSLYTPIHKYNHTSYFLSSLSCLSSPPSFSKTTPSKKKKHTHETFRLSNKGSVGLILVKASAMRISIPLHLSSRPFIPLPSFIGSGRPTTLLVPSLVFSPLRSV